MLTAGGSTVPGSRTGPARAYSLKLRLSADLSGLMAGLTVATAIAFAVIIGAVAFRLGAQFMAETRLAVPAGWLYDAGGRFAEPFHDQETGPGVSGTSVIEFATMVALEAYLIAGFLAVLLLTGLSVLSKRFSSKVWTLSIDLSGLAQTWASLAPSLSAFSTAAEVRAERLTTQAGRAGWGCAVFARRSLIAVFRAVVDTLRALPPAARGRVDAAMAGKRRMDEHLHAAAELLQPVADWSKQRASKAVAGVRGRHTSPDRRT